MTKTKQNGFTLIELIIVVTIIAVLASIAFLSLSGETSQARDAKREADLKTFEDSISMSNAKGRNITYLTPNITTVPINTQFIQTDKGKVRVLRNAKAFQVAQNFIDATILSTVPRDPKGSPYMVAFINGNIFQLVATLEQPETKVPEALVRGSFKAGAVVDNILVAIDNDDTLIPVGNASQFIRGDIIQIETEKMTVKEIAIDDNFIIVERDPVNSTIHSNRETIKLQQFASNASSLFCVGENLVTLTKSVATANIYTPAVTVPENLTVVLGDIELNDMYTCSNNESVQDGKTVIIYGVNN